ncbi:NADP-specific glutamate dehydrogenase [Sulfitobacter sabulilitoris]|uniref:Glutamate dehydrogenase n=1 Tax=Sulfitobacter sabulilitoris TaxID=2562655 RepID=A0A5S3PI90_9RHOB|nr:NADP-specific glutamate dehydrogenase [Sulfitobacter sabulilitoris]TMM54048.1 NADP-specific glutamate dehydrogenase [Sulfitobacter sabulilitoris]
MPSPAKLDVDDFLSRLKDRTPHEDAFHQAVGEVAADVIPMINDRPAYREAALLERMVEPDRVVSFRVEWVDDDGRVQVNRGYRVQFNSAIGPYKGGLRFHPTVTPSVLKFLGFEQTFKNALTGLPMGGGKGGSDFDPSGRSEAEIMRFCQSFMLELYRHIGPDIDVPAGDINVGAREIGYLFGAYKRITNNFEGVLTGKGLSYGGSEMRTEATGYGVVQFLDHMLAAHGRSVDGQNIVISGAGNVATYAAELATDRGAKVITLSDSRGTIHDKDGLTPEKIDWVRDHKSKPGASLEAYANAFDAEWLEGKAPWGVACDIALPCATQNELDEEGVKSLIDGGCFALVEGANMPVTSKGLKAVQQSDLLYAPGKAANAGGVTVSGLEISQNQMRRDMTKEELCALLKDAMKEIHDKCAQAGRINDARVDYARGANIAGFEKVATAMLAQGVF